MRRLASTRLTLVGMALLAIGSGLSYGNPEHMTVWVLVVPMAVLAVNLSAAIISNSRINRRAGLLVFHISLLLIVILAAIGRLTHVDARVEVVVGTEYSGSDVYNIKSGPFFEDRLEEIKFFQGPFTVSYMPWLTRGPTNALITYEKDGEVVEQIIGDDRPLIIDGYRFYTSYNKGFAPLLTWYPDDGSEPMSGTVHMPSYPLYEYRQDSSWTPPGSEEIKFWLQLSTAYDEDSDWVLERETSHGVLVVNVDGERVELLLGEEIQLAGGRLQYRDLTMWMGYKVFYDPTIHWLFYVSVIGVLGLSFHFWKRFANLPINDEKASTAENKSGLMPRNYRVDH